MERGQFFEHLDQQLGRQQSDGAPATPVVASDQRLITDYLRLRDLAPREEP